MPVLTRLFPTPSSIALSAVGVDFSATTVRFLKLERQGRYLVPVDYIEKAFPEGAISGGVITDEKRLIPFLRSIKEQYDFSYARITIPESHVFLFTVSFDRKKVKNIRTAIAPLIEEYTLLKTKEATFDYSILRTIGDAVVVQVVAVPTKIVNDFVFAFEKAGIHILSVEFDAQAIARAVVAESEKGTQMIVDIGASHTGFSVVTQGVVVYTETLSFGGNIIAERVAKKLSLSIEEVEVLKRASGLTRATDQYGFFSAFSQELTPIIGELNKTFIYWQERRKLYGGFPAIDKIYICGGHSTMAGIAEYIGLSLKIPVVAANPWTNCLDFNEIIPPLSMGQAMSFVPAIGTALANHIPSTNLLTQRRQEKIRHVRWFRLLNTSMWLLVLLFASFGVLLLPSYLLAKKEKDNAQEKIAPYIVDIGGLQARVSAIQTAVPASFDTSASEAVGIVNTYVPQGVHIASYTYESEGKIVLVRGVVPLKQALDEYVAALESDARVAFVESPLANFLIQGESEFTLRVGIK